MDAGLATLLGVIVTALSGAALAPWIKGRVERANAADRAEVEQSRTDHETAMDGWREALSDARGRAAAAEGRAGDANAAVTRLDGRVRDLTRAMERLQETATAAERRASDCLAALEQMRRRETLMLGHISALETHAQVLTAMVRTLGGDPPVTPARPTDLR